MSRGTSCWLRAAFDLGFDPWMRLRLGRVLLTGLPRQLPIDRPLLLISNHSSWWDPFLLREVQRALRPGAPVHSVMLARELERRPLLRGLGAIGIDPSAAPSFARAVRELEARAAERPDSVILFFPQGRIRPSFVRPLGFRRGVELLGRRLGAVALPVGVHLEPLTSPNPSCFVSAGSPVHGEDATASMLQDAVEGELDAIQGLLATQGENAPAVWPGRWQRIAR